MKKSRKALLTSALSLLLCFSMLLGTTYAWFTDSVTSTNNLIQAGNLDIELEYWDEDNAKWKTVKSDTSLFEESTLWEPGYTQVVYLRAANKGTLALKYQLGINIVDETEGIRFDKETGKDVSFKLSDSIYMGVKEDLNGEDTPYATREAAVADVENDAGIISTGFSKSGEMNAGDGEQYLAVVVYMPTSVGNEANHKTGTTPPKITLGIKVVATQKDAEMDSFGDDYDVDAEWPEVADVTASVKVEVENNKVKAPVTVGMGAVQASIPADVAVNEGTDTLTLSVSKKDSSDSNVTAKEDEQLMALDVHMDGVAEGNTTPITIALGKVLPKGLNMGNVALYHVEDGVTNVMTQVDTLSELDAHNEFYYDPATGEVTVAMATFSEVTVVADAEAKWEGKVDHSWYVDKSSPYIIANADQLWSFSQIVGGMAKDENGNFLITYTDSDGDEHHNDTFSGKTVKLISDINLADDEENNVEDKIFYPIGYWNNEGTYEKTGTDISSGFYAFEGTFDGNGHIISNFYQNTWEMKGDHTWYDASLQYYRDGMGLFGKVYGGTVKNLTIDNFKSDGEITTTGCVAAYADCGTTFENISIKNSNPRVYNIGNGGIVGCVGWYTNDAHTQPVTFRNITVDNSNKISALWGSYDVACGGIVGQYYPTSGQSNAIDNAGIKLENCHVAAQMDVYNDVCGNYQYYAYRYAGMLIGSVRENLPKDANGHVYPNMDGITATGCTVHYDSWNDYYYCELVANSKASYTHDHQFSRLTEVKAINGTTITYLDNTTGTVPASGSANYVIVDYTKGHGTENATCYHFVDGKVHNHTDYNNDGVEDYETVDGENVLVEDKQHIYLPFAQLFTGYGWGVTSKGLDAFDGVGVTHRDSTDMIEKFEKNEALSGDFLYRVGNGNAFPIGKLFQEAAGLSDADAVVDSGVHVAVESLLEGVTLTGTFVKNETDWTQSTLHITGGTGPAKLTIQDYNNCEPFELVVEVVDATNHSAETISSLSGNTVLLCDTDLVSDGSLSLSGATLYGNDFEIDMKAGAYAAGGDTSSNYVFNLADAHLDNVKLVGAVYTTYGATVQSEYNRAAVLSSGNSTITNSYVSNCASAVRVKNGYLEITNSTLQGGNFANLDIRGGNVVLDNVTTINQVNGNDLANDGSVVFGLGIVVYYENVPTTTRVTIKNGLTQYNHISKAQVDSYITDETANALVNVMFDSDFETLQYNDGSTTWVNAGIVSMSGDTINANSITGPNDYAAVGPTEVTIRVNNLSAAKKAYVQSKVPTATSIAASAPAYSTVGQSSIAPNCRFDYTSKNYEPVTEGNNRYCYYDESAVRISIDKGDTFNWDTSILTVTKNGQTIVPTVSMNGTDYTGESIPFTQAGTYTVKYSYADGNNYGLDNGNITTYSQTYEKTVPIVVSVIEDTTVYAEFAFANGGTTKKVQIGNDTYISVDGVSADSSKWGSMTIGDQTIYFPIVNAEVTGSFNKNAQAYFYVFDGVITITDGENIYNSSTQTKPDGLNVVKGWYGKATDIDSTWVNFSQTLNQTGPAKVFKYAASSDAPSDPITRSNKLCYTSPGSLNRSEVYYTMVQYSYTDAAKTYYYYVGYVLNNPSGCVTGDTLVMLADGSQKRVDELTYQDELLVWDFYNGCYTASPAAVIVDHGYATYNVTNLHFSDGTTVKMISEHDFFDADANDFVYLAEDNAKSYIGHRFVKMDGSDYTTVTLVDVTTTVEETGSYSLLTAKHFNCMVEGMLSLTPDPSNKYEKYLHRFEVGENMKYDEEKMQADIEKYGLYTYEDFAAYGTYEQFVAFDAAYLKIYVGKGFITFEDILAAFAFWI